MSTLDPPLYVDLDGTVLSTDLLYESFISAFKASPWVALQSVGWLAQGRAHLKEQLAARASIDVTTLPYRADVLAFLRDERARGRRIVLTTASWITLAQAVAHHLGLFDEVLATSQEGNLKGEAKALRIAQLSPAGCFDYLGDSAADLHVWRHCRHAYVVDAASRISRRIPQGIDVKRVFRAEGGAGGGRAAIRALRPYQWAKNLLVFVPLVTAHRLVETPALLSAAWAFAAFCLVASGAYILNDLLDLPADRAHPSKRLRPFASGELGIPEGLVMLAGCLLAAGGIATMLPPLFRAALAMYLALTVAYSLVLKRMSIVDVLALAGLYTLRIIAGTYAIAAALSFWLLAFAMFIFFSLALVKRYAELAALEDAATRAPGRGYAGRDLEVVLAIGTASAMVSALVLALYINGETAKELYQRPEVLWLLCPTLLYWISRIWLLAARGQMHEDPVLFAVRDRASWVAAAAALAVMMAAT
ncbi:MAG TPA: UbiA family prenyltransferase [Usitatibacter sp.]|nr:UbiA family prenyltransferase [Usitatibacter sp.]